MIHEQIQQIESKLRGADGLSAETRADLLGLVAVLHREIDVLSQTRAEDAHSVTGFAAASAHEATRQEKKPALLESALDGLTESVAGVEVSHPKLAEVVNQIAVALSNMGI